MDYATESQQTTLNLDTPLKPGDAELQIKFVGCLNDKMAGFYRSKYTVNGEEKWMATTQFESTDARRAFPCWDEPALKAKFRVSLSIPKSLDALGNMPIKTKEEEGDLVKFTFEESPIMSTYLLAFIVGEFDYVEDKTNEGVLVRVYTPPGKSEQGKYALDIACRTLSFYTEYFGISYPLPKSDMIAIADFSSGAMENWGLITYRETALLIDSSSGITQKQRVAYVVAHELAHQWFGNLVTMEWWKELWLNEGFATWVGNLAVAEFYPEWNIWTSFSSSYFSNAQSLDSMLTTHPIEVEVYNSAEIDEIFDAISYCKGASIIRMIATYLGEEAFKKGLNIYLNRHQYANATTDDLWKALSESSGKNVKQFMDNWIKRPGLPVLTVKQVDENPNQLSISQERFLSSGKKATEEQNSIWNCSIGVLTEHTKEPIFIEFNSESQVITLPDGIVKDSNDWIKLNASQSGFFFVNYDSKMLNNLTKAVNEKKLSPLDCIGLLSDAYSLTKSGRMKTSQLLQLLQGFSNETEYTVIEEIYSSLSAINTIWENQPCSDSIRKFAADLVSPTVKRLGWDSKKDDSDLDKLLRVLAISNASKYGDKDVINEALKRFEQGRESIDADIRRTVYKIAVQHGPEENFEKMKEIFRSAPMHAEKLQALSAMGASKDPSLKLKTLEFVVLGDEVRSQDIVYGPSSVNNSLEGTEIAWNFLKENWETYKTKLAGSGYLLARCIQYSSSGFLSEERAVEVENYFKEHPTPQAERAIQQTLESIRSKSAWLNRDKDDVNQYFS